MSPRSVARIKLSRRVRVTLDLDVASHAILVATASHLGKPEAEVVADALRLLFVALPRPGEGATG